MKTGKRRGKILHSCAKALVFLICILGAGSICPEVRAEDKDKTRLVFWSWLPTNQQADQMLKLFEEENPDIEVEYLRMEQDDYQEQLQTAVVSGKGPDLFALTTTSMERYAPYVADMGELSDRWWPEWGDCIQEELAQQCVTSLGRMAGMPLLQAGVFFLLYNRTLMEEYGIQRPPKSMDDLIQAAQTAKQNGCACIAAGAMDAWLCADWFVQVSNEFEKGAVYEAEEGKRPWTDECFVDTLKTWKQLFDEGVFENYALGVRSYPEAIDSLFFERKALFFLTGSWQLVSTRLDSDAPENSEVRKHRDELGMCVFPSMSGTGKAEVTTGVDIMLCVSRSCHEEEAAIRLVRFFADGDGAQYWADQMQGTPVSERISFKGKIDGPLQDTSMREVQSCLDHSAGSRKLKSRELEASIAEAMQNTAAGMEPEEAVKALDQGFRKNR